MMRLLKGEYSPEKVGTMADNTHDMAACNVFNVWSGDYDEDVRLTDENKDYPFAGYKKIVDMIYAAATKRFPASVLDIGVGTGTLAAALYEHGQTITGIDFSDKMLAIAKAKMPNAMFYQCDFTKWLPYELKEAKYDFIISTYALHHLPDPLKATFIKSLLPLLSDNGAMLIGDIGFPDRAELEECKKQNASGWDDSEYYLVFSELIDALKDVCEITYEQTSHCGGVMEIRMR
jgi:putative AdoMet-dependent methyltransferase